MGEYSGQRLCDFHLRVAKCRDTTGHRMDWRECGYGFGGLLDLYCVDCQELVRSVPLDDVPAGVLDWVDEVRR